MRKVCIILSALFISGFIIPLQAQKAGNFDLGVIYATSMAPLQAEADSLASFLNKGYQFVEEKHQPGLYTDLTTRTYRSSEGRSLHITIDKDVAGGNDALEIKDHPYYFISNISGKYKDLFSIWHLLNPKADIVKTTKADYASTVVRPPFLTSTRDMITFGSAIVTEGTHRDVWKISFLLSSYLQEKFGSE
jgi:hypothetical protein